MLCDLEVLPGVSRQSKEALDLVSFTQGTMVELQLYEIVTASIFILNHNFGGSCPSALPHTAMVPQVLLRQQRRYPEMGYGSQSTSHHLLRSQLCCLEADDVMFRDKSLLPTASGFFPWWVARRPVLHLGGTFSSDCV